MRKVDGPGPARVNKLSEGQFNEAIIAPLSEFWRKKEPNNSKNISEVAHVAHRLSFKLLSFFFLLV